MFFSLIFVSVFLLLGLFEHILISSLKSVLFWFFCIVFFFLEEGVMEYHSVIEAGV